MDGVTTVTDRGVPPEPTTEAGRALLAHGDDFDIHWRDFRSDVVAGILAIEAEAEARTSQPLTLDVERLARALDSVPFDSEMTQGTLARYIAGEYERLSRYEVRVGQVAVALHEACLLEWQAKDALSPGRDQTMHMADAHYGRAHDLARRTWPELDREGT